MAQGGKTGSDNKHAGESGRTHFGYQDVGWEEKAGRVREVFDSVADRYDLMNDLMSFGIHRLWKRFAISQSGLKPGQLALDVAGGTGDLACLLAAKVGREGRVVLSDINAAMLDRARPRLLDRGIAGNVSFVQADVQELPFADRAFDCVTIAFGLRNVTDKERALRSVFRLLKPGGQLLILEFSQPVIRSFARLYDLYSFAVLPILGRLVAKDADSYRYLAESIRVHPDQETLLGMLRDCGFGRCRYHNLSGGVVALHRGYRL